MILDSFRLDGCVAIVTGASSGLGVAFARALAEASADVALGARRADRLEETKAVIERLGRRAVAVATDVAEPGDCQNLVRETVEQLGRVDVLVNISSVLGLTTAGLPQAAYSASKAGLIGLTRNLAQQWTGRRGIRVNAIAPGFFASEMTEQCAPEYVEAVGSRILAGRWGDEGETVVFLAGPGAGYITGQTLPVDGGITIT